MDSGGLTETQRAMAFFTDLFSRPRPQDSSQFRVARIVLNVTSRLDRTAGMSTRPVDFPRLSRQMALR